MIQHDDQILELRNKVNKYYKLLHSLSGNLASGVISRDDYALLRERYQTEIKSLESNIEKQEEYMEDLLVLWQTISVNLFDINRFQRF